MLTALTKQILNRPVGNVWQQLQRESQDRESSLLAAIEQAYSTTIKSSSDWMTMKVDRIVQESPSVRSIYLVPTLQRPLPMFQAGQHVVVSNRQHPAIEQQSIPPSSRCYTLSGVPNPNFWRVSIKRSSDSEASNVNKSFSNFIHDHVKAGDCLQIKGPSGHFHYQPQTDRPVLLFAAGIGITPSIPIAVAALSASASRSVWLFYQSQNPEDAALSKEVLKLASANPNFHVTFAFSRVTASSGRSIEGNVELICSRLAPKEILKLANTYARGDCYLCGPTKWMQDLIEGLEAASFKDHVYFESFGGNMPTSTIEEGLSNSTNESIEVKLLDSKRDIRFEANYGSLLDQLQKAGVDITGGCRVGHCGTCMTRLLAGEVCYDAEASSDLEAGWILPCIAKPKTAIELQL
jgi:uncharacterized protein